MKTLNYGIIGCGMMGQEHMHNIALLKAAKVRTIYEPNAEIRAAAQQIAPDVIFADSIDDLLKVSDLDYLLIARLIEAAPGITGGVQMITIREHRFPFLPKINNWNRFNTNTGGTFVEKCRHFFDLMRLITRSKVVRVMASGGQINNRLDECHDGKMLNILDHGYVLLDFANGVRGMLESCMFADGSRYQEEISLVGSIGKIEARVPGSTRF